MWIRLKDDLINLNHVKFIGMSSGGESEHRLYFLQGDEKTVYVKFDNPAKAKKALDWIQKQLEAKSHR